MRTFWSIIIIAIWLLLGYLLCNSSKECCGTLATSDSKIVNESPQPTTTPEIETFTPESGPLLFNWDSEDPIVGPNWEKLRDSLLTGLGEGQKLRIVGNYFSDESNSSAYENLGLARAHEIKNKLFPDLTDDKVELLGRLSSDREGIKEHPFRSSAFSYAIYNESIKEIDDKRMMYFPFNSTDRIKDPQIEEYLKDLAQRLSKTDEKVVITGHTCDIGTDQSNYYLGEWRAEVVKKYLMESGIDATRITTKSSGEKDPLVPNTSEANRKQNRRAVIELIK